MVINGRGKICLNHRPVFSYGKTGTVLYIALDQHHPVGLAETPGGTFACIPVDLHVGGTESCLIHVPLKSRAFQEAGSHLSLHLKNQYDLFDRPAGNFPPQLDCLFQKFLIIVWHGIFAVPDPLSRFKPFKTTIIVGTDIPAKGAFRYPVLFCQPETQFTGCGRIQVFIKKR